METNGLTATDASKRPGVRIRRCKTLYFELREEIGFDLASLLQGADGMRRHMRCIALAPHLGEECDVSIEDLALLERIGPSSWIDTTGFDDAEMDGVLHLVERGLVLRDDQLESDHACRDASLRAGYWHDLGSAFHAFTRWSERDSVASMRDSGTSTALELREVLGAPAPEAARLCSPELAIALPTLPSNDFDALLARRATCRNFDSDRALPFGLFAQLMHRVFAAQAEVRISSDTVFLKKNVPSGGGLHPIEAYLVVQNVEGIAPGLYHYQAQDHALEPLIAPEQPLRDFILAAVAQQHWFADAHVLVVLSPRFDRTFWKYRQHAKGYRVVALEAGHVSQTLYLAATDAGLGAFITAAVNEVQIEQAFGLDHAQQGVMAVCGFGWRGAVMENPELDPAGRVWAKA